MDHPHNRLSHGENFQVNCDFLHPGCHHLMRRISLSSFWHNCERGSNPSCYSPEASHQSSPSDPTFQGRMRRLLSFHPWTKSSLFHIIIPSLLNLLWHPWISSWIPYPLHLPPPLTPLKSLSQRSGSIYWRDFKYGDFTSGEVLNLPLSVSICSARATLWGLEGSPFFLVYTLFLTNDLYNWKLFSVPFTQFGIIGNTSCRDSLPQRNKNGISQKPRNWFLAIMVALQSIPWPLRLFFHPRAQIGNLN